MKRGGPPFTPNIAMANQFLKALDHAGIFTFQTFCDRKESSDGSLIRVLHGSLVQHASLLAKLNARGAGIFVMVNRGDGIVHPGEKTCRTGKNVIAVRSLFADLDGSPLAPVIAALQPDIVVESSPGRWHAYWLTNDCPLTDFRLCQQRIAMKFNSDPKVVDLPRVMRLPGFIHQKAEPFMAHMTYPE